jgi:hypothetical protein
MAVTNFNLNPGLGPVPAAGAWLYSNYPGITATLANSSTAVTAINIGTSFLKVGMVVTGAGIVNNPPTTISAIGSSTAITLSQATTSSASGTGVALNFTGIPGLQGTQFGNYGFYGVPDPTLTDVPGCAWAIPETQTLNPSAVFTPAPGQGWISLAAGTTTATSIQINLNPTPTWTTIFTGSTSAATVFTGIWSDGTNLRINLAGSVAAAFTFYRQRYQPIY